MFRTALDHGDLRRVRLLAAQMPSVRLDDALRICLLIREGDPDRYDRAAVRWLGRFALEARYASLKDLQRAAAALDALPEQPADAMEQLSGLCVEHRLMCS